MRSISSNIRCRPIRLAFLVRPNNPSDFKKAIEANTVLWGGVYNPIIPYYKHITPIWQDKFSSNLTAKDIIKGYILNFQPDYLVKTFDVDLPEDIFPNKRVLELKDVINVSNKQKTILYGLDMMDLYEYAWKKTFRFVQKNPPKSYLPTIEGKTKLFGSCLWGLFPEEPLYYGRNFCQIFDAEIKKYQEPETLLFDTITPLNLTYYYLKPHEREPDPCVFVLNDCNLLDLIDYWNLRASGRICIPWPTSTLDKLKEEIRKFMEQYKWKAACNDTKLTYPYLIHSRSISKENLDSIVKVLSLDKSQRLICSFYPTFWLDRTVNGKETVVHYYSEKHETIEVKDDYARITTLSPEFANSLITGRPRWINVISTKEYLPETLPSNIIPNDIKDVNCLLRVPSFHGSWNCESGLAICLDHKDSSTFYYFPDAIGIGKHWFQERGYDFNISNSGHILRSLIDVIGGLHSGRWLANKDVLNVLEEMADKGYISSKTFSGILKKANKEAKIDLFDLHFNFFNDKGIIKLGSKVQCPHCQQYPFYVLENLSHELICLHCTRSFKYPISNPSNKWQYRTTGPFTAPRDNQGAYTTLLSLRFLDEQLDADTTCIPSCILKPKSGKDLEADFVCFWNKRSWNDIGRYVIFGECKTHYDFDKADINRMKTFAAKFPNSILAFCTLKESLSNTEKRLLKQLAEQGRKPKKSSYWPTPVLILTANELCEMMPNDFRHRAGEKDSKGVAAYLHNYGFTMLDLCDATQRYYLDLPPRYEWLDKYYKKKYNK